MGEEKGGNTNRDLNFVVPSKLCSITVENIIFSLYNKLLDMSAQHFNIVMFVYMPSGMWLWNTSNPPALLCLACFFCLQIQGDLDSAQQMYKTSSSFFRRIIQLNI